MSFDRRKFIKTAGVGAAMLGSGVFPLRSAIASSEGPIRLGFISSMTGAQAPLGQPMLMGAQIAVDQINAAGGVLGRKLELVVRDDKARPNDATVAAREISGEGVKLLLGVVSSSVALALNAMLQQEKQTLITCAAHSDRLTKENFNRNYFRVTDNPYMRMCFMSRALADRNPAVTAWGGIVPDHEYGRTTWNCFEEGLREHYAKVGGDHTISSPLRTQYGATDYRNIIGSAMGLPAEGFFVSVYGGDAVTLFQQARPYGFFTKAKVIVDSANEFIVAKAMKHAMPEMWVGTHWYHGAFTDVKASNDLFEEYKKRTNGDAYPDGWLAEGHAAVMAYARAIQEAGNLDTDTIVSALEGITFETAAGPRHFRKEDHQAIKPLIMYRLRGSKEADVGFEVLEYIKLPGEDYIDDPTPGVPLAFKYIKV